MNMIEAVKSVLGQYVGFSGRARRSEYWYWILASTLVSMGLALIEELLGFGDSGPFSMVYSLAILLPGLAVTFRRLHDTGRSGWWIIGFYLSIVIVSSVLLYSVLGTMNGVDVDTSRQALFGVFGIIFGLAFVIYAFAILYFLCQDSHVGPNKYGPNPKNEGNYAIFE